MPNNQLDAVARPQGPNNDWTELRGLEVQAYDKEERQASGHGWIEQGVTRIRAQSELMSARYQRPHDTVKVQSTLKSFAFYMTVWISKAIFNSGSQNVNSMEKVNGRLDPLHDPTPLLTPLWPLCMYGSQQHRKNKGDSPRRNGRRKIRLKKMRKRNVKKCSWKYMINQM